MKKTRKPISEVNLLNCQKPARYIPVECNAIRKDFEKARIRVLLAFPDTYEIGMSNMGFNIIYHVINRHEDFAAERVFAPWSDFESELKKAGKKLYSLETGTDIVKFDIVGFSIHYELSYTNILKILDLSGIPLYAKDRGDEYPIIMGGGSGIYNPEPLADFFDLFLIGDGEEGILEILKTLDEAKREKWRKHDILKELTKIEGAYVPSLYEVKYHDDGRISCIKKKEKGVPVRVRKRVVKDLDRSFALDNPLVPVHDIVHDRLGVEISRGCLKGCRFCQAGMVYRPLRERSASKIMDILHVGLENTGYEDVSLLSLNVTEYSNLNQIISGFFEEYGNTKVSLSLPSLYPEKFEGYIPEAIRSSKKTGLTLVLEAATERLRNVINKNISGKMVTDSALAAVKSGWQHIKLYFMIGLPTEEDDDINALIKYSHNLYSECRKTSKQFRSLRISISPFCPKPHTPFQWMVQDEMDKLKGKIDFIKNSLKKFRGIRLSFNRPEASFLEAVLARGDRRLSKVIVDAYKIGCSFDAWTEHYKFDLWRQAFDKNHLIPEFYANRARPLDEIFPWDHIDTRVKKEFLLDEYQKALEGVTSLDCQSYVCYLCGACDNHIKNDIKPEDAYEPKLKSITLDSDPVEHHFYRGKLTKLGNFKYISHLDFIRMISRAFRRSGLPVAYTEGFSPKQKLSTGPALPLGMESYCEYIDFFLAEDLLPEEVRIKMNAILPSEVQFQEIEKFPQKLPSISSSIDRIEYQVVFQGKSEFDLDSIKTRIKKILSKDRLMIEMEKNGQTDRIDIRPYIEEMSILREDELVSIEVILKYINGKVCKITDLLSLTLNSLDIDIKRDPRIVKKDLILKTP